MPQHNYSETQTEMFVKGIDYGSEEYIKQLLASNSKKKTLSLFPFCEVISYPSDDFLTNQLALKQPRLFASLTYVGHMDFICDMEPTEAGPSPSISVLTFTLDGKTRQFIKVCKPNVMDVSGLKFLDFAIATYPKANHHLAYNRNGIHVLKDIQVSGAAYQPKVGGGFQVQEGNFVPSLEFEWSVSGYTAQQS